MFSRSHLRREEFAARLGAELGIDVEPAAEAAEVTGSAPVTVLCTKAVTPVVDGRTFAPDAVVLSIGSTRPDLRELDNAAFARARAVLVDDVAAVLAESGDVASAVACGAIGREALVSMAGWSGSEALDNPGRDLLVFKSVGTALQDLALAAALIGRATELGFGRDIGDITELKSAAP